LAAPITSPIAPACSLENYLVLPDRSMDDRIRAAKRELAGEAIILGHHYQRDEVVKFADYRGDSYRLSKVASEPKSKTAGSSWSRLASPTMRARVLLRLRT
jgi:quinolinate synthase